MLQEMVNYAVEHKASQAALHKVFYHKFREKYPWLPTRIIKGCYRDAVRRTRSFRKIKKKGIAKTDKSVDEVRVKLMNPYQGLTSLTELKILKTN